MLIKKTILGLSTLLLPLLAVTQTIKLENVNLEFTLPGNKWVFIPDRTRPQVKSYVRIENKSEKNSPILMIIFAEGRQFSSVTQFSNFLRTGENTSLKKFSQLTPVSDYIQYEKAALFRGTINIPSGNLYGYDAYLLCGNTGIYFNLSVTESFSSLYDAEFLSILKSIKNASNSPIVPKTSSSSAQTNTSNQKSGGTSDNCSYFPVINGMKFTYKRNDMTGEHNIVESYTVVKDKTLKSGKVIKGYKINTTVANRNNTIIYYYCDNGSIKMYSEMPAYNTYIKEYVEDYSVLPSDYNKPDYKKTPVWETEKYGSGKYLSFTELEAGGEGTEWTDRQVVNENPVTISNEIVETGLSLTVQGKKYSPVIHVERTVTINYLGEDMELNTQDIYYAKGVGKIRVVEKGKDLLMGNSFTTTQELVSHNLPAKLEKTDNKFEEAKKGNGTKISSKRKIDESLTGTWKNFRSDRVGGMTLIYRLNPDGSFEYYGGKPTPQNLLEKGSWEMNKDTLVLSIEKPGSDGYVKKYPVQKINNAYSGKPSIVFTWDQSLTKEFETMDNKNPWKDKPAYGDKMEPQINESIILKGVIDPEMEGQWYTVNVHSYKITRPDEYYKFNKDGTGEIKSRIFPIKKFEWRINNNQLWILTDCGLDDKCMNKSRFEKKTLPSGKPAIEFDGFLYIRQ